LKSLALTVSAYAITARDSALRAATPAANVEIIELSATAAVDRIRRGDLSAERYAQVLLDQYRAHKNLNTVTYIDEAQALEDARAVDQARAKGAQLGRLAGLPIMLKDNINTVGFSTTAGTSFLRDYRPKANAPIADILFKQGVVLFAKSNMHELAMGNTSGNKTFGFVKNPYNLSRSPGGSSGGTAAALAARIIPMGFGSDTNGSIRMPAHFCGIAGFRPSNPKINKPYPVEGIVPNVLDFDVAGPLARNVADIALVHAAVTSEPVATSAKLRGLRIGVPRAYFWETLDPDIASIMDGALDKLRAAGAVLVDVDFSDLVKALRPVSAVLDSEGKRTDLADFLVHNYPAMSMSNAIAGVESTNVRQLLEAARDHAAPPEAVLKARATMDALGAQYQDACRQQNIVAIAFPTLAIPAPPQGEVFPLQIEINGRNYPNTVINRNMIICRLCRAPGLSIPAGLTPDGLPAGLELDGLPGEDSLLLSIGMAVEEVLGPVPPPTFREM
jgi:Asp-tRNA(Asn)/Glu-tRNA(Gln) amidotransferase A subunit family amidase